MKGGHEKQELLIETATQSKEHVNIVADFVPQLWLKFATYFPSFSRLLPLCIAEALSNNFFLFPADARSSQNGMGSRFTVACPYSLGETN